MSEKSLTHGIKFKDKIGYAMGDMGGLLTFSLIGAFQTSFTPMCCTFSLPRSWF